MTLWAIVFWLLVFLVFWVFYSKYYFRFPFIFILSVLYSSGTIFLLAFWMCHSTVVWPPLFLMMSQPLIIMLVSCIEKVAFLLLFSRFFPLVFRTMPRHIIYYSWCVLVKLSLWFSYLRFCFYTASSMYGSIFFIKCEKFSVIISSNLFLPLSLSDSSRNHYLYVCMLDSMHRSLRLCLFSPLSFSEMCFLLVYLYIYRFFFLPS